jgi:hypothetical protein
MKKRKVTATGRSDIQAIVSQCRISGGDAETVHALATKFRRRNKDAQGLRNADLWEDWYFSACFGYAYSLIRQHGKDRWAMGAYIINSIASNLLATDGAVALAIFGALAGKEYDLGLSAGANWHQNSTTFSTQHPKSTQRGERTSLK